MRKELALDKPIEMDRLSLGQKLSYAFGYVGVSLITQVVMVWTLYFYAPPEGKGITHVPIELAGLALAASRIVDSASDVIVGIASDRTRTKYGRRRPYILFGAPLLAVAFALLWTPPVIGPSLVNFAYLFILLLFFFTLYTVVVGPYLALFPEIATTKRDRIVLATWQAVFNVAGLGIATLGSTFLIEKAGFKGMGLAIAVLALISFLIPGLTVKERFSECERRPGFFEEFRFIFGNRAFRIYTISKLLIWFGFNMVIVSLAYITTIVIGLPRSMAGVVFAVALGIAAICFKPVGEIADKYGKKKTLAVSSLILAAAMALIPLIGHVPLPVSKVVQGVIVISLVGAPASALFVLPNAFIADIADHGASMCDHRLEGAYFGVQGFLNKVCMGLSSLAVGYVLGTFGYSASKPLGILLIGPLAAAFVVAGVAVFSEYELD